MVADLKQTLHSLRDSRSSALEGPTKGVDAALARLDTLTKSDFQAFKKLGKKPPPCLKLMFHAMCLLMKTKPKKNADESEEAQDWWGAGLKLGADLKLVSALKGLNRDKVNAVVAERIRKEFLPQKDFNPNAVQEICKAAEVIMEWILAMSRYAVVLHEYTGVQTSVELTEPEYNQAIAVLQALKAKIAEPLATFKDLSVELFNAQIRERNLEERTESKGKCSELTKQLVELLEEEVCGWSAAAASLQRKLETLTGDTLFSCVLMSFSGEWSSKWRDMFSKDLCGIMGRRSLNISDDISFLAANDNPAKHWEWEAQSLPMDRLGMENRIIVTQALRWPLLIDAEGLGKQWIRKLEQTNHLFVAKPQCGEEQLLSLKKAVTTGLPVLLEMSTDTFSLVFEQIVLQQRVAHTKLPPIWVDGEAVNCSPEFRFYISTSLANPHFEPRFYGHLQPVNFALTTDEVQVRLLKVAVETDCAELGKEQADLLALLITSSRQQELAEAHMLCALSDSPNILHDGSALETVVTSTRQMLDAKCQLTKLAKRRRRFVQESSKYQRLVNESLSTYKSIRAICLLNPMYTFPLSWYLELFKSTIANDGAETVNSRWLFTEMSKIPDLVRGASFEEFSPSICCSRAPPESVLHFQNIDRTFQHLVRVSVTNSTFARHTLAFPFLQAVQHARGSISHNEWNFWLKVYDDAVKKSEYPNPDSSWITDSTWDALFDLSRHAPRLCQYHFMH